MSMLVRRISFLLFSLFLLPAAPAAAQASKSTADSKKEKPVSAKDDKTAADAGPLVVTLWDCLKMSKKNHPAVMAAKFKLISLKKQLDEAHWAPFFNIGMTTLLAPTSTMKGNALSSEGGDLGDYTSLGIWVRLELQAGFPIFTFGKIKSYWKMAEEGVTIGKMELQKQVNEIDFEVRRAYLTAVFARQMKSVLEEGKDYLDEARDKIEEDLENEEGEATLSDQLKVKAYSAQLDSQLIQIQHIEEVAMAGLRFLTGRDNIEVKDEIIEIEEGSLKNLSYYVEEAKKNRPEFAILDSAVKVSKAKVKLNKSKYLPDFLLVGKYTFAYANKVDPQDTPFAHDPYNTNAGGVALLMNYPFDFVPNYYRTDKAKAQLLEMQAQQEAATGAFLLEVEKAYGEAKSLHDAVKALKKGKKAAKGWIVATHQNYQAGLAELKDFTDALVTYFMLTGDYYKAIYDYNVALSSLRLATGSTKLW
jgi:outer membrane protein TolC